MGKVKWLLSKRGEKKRVFLMPNAFPEESLHCDEKTNKLHNLWCKVILGYENKNLYGQWSVHWSPHLLWNRGESLMFQECETKRTFIKSGSFQLGNNAKAQCLIKKRWRNGHLNLLTLQSLNYFEISKDSQRICKNLGPLPRTLGKYALWENKVLYPQLHQWCCPSMSLRCRWLW